MPTHALSQIDTILQMLSLLGTAVFAASGALAAARLGQTFVTFCFFALVTGVGGGTVRDLLIGVPVFWVREWIYGLICLAAALAIWVTPSRIWSAKALEWLDAIGLATFAAYGAAKALSVGVHPVPAAMMGIVTGCVGGILRDLLANEPSILLRPELYVTAAALASMLFVVLTLLGVSVPVAGVIAALTGFALRAIAIVKGLSLPGYRP